MITERPWISFQRTERISRNLQIGWIDAASNGLELSPKDGGVGMARKIGFDLALPQLAFNSSPPLLLLAGCRHPCSPRLSARHPETLSRSKRRRSRHSLLPSKREKSRTASRHSALRAISAILCARSRTGRLPLCLSHGGKRHGLPGGSLRPHGRNESSGSR